MLNFKKWFYRLFLCTLDMHKSKPAETIKNKTMYRCVYCGTRTTRLPWPDPPSRPKEKENNVRKKN